MTAWPCTDYVGWQPKPPPPKLEPHWNHGARTQERRRPPLRTALGVLVGLLQGFLQPYAMVGLDSGGGIRTRDLRVMSPTSYQTAPPRGGAVHCSQFGPELLPLGRVGRGVLVVAVVAGRRGVALVIDVGVELAGVVVEHLGVVRRVRGLGVAQGGLAVADAVGAFVTHHAPDTTHGPRPHHPA